jgi:phosphatidylglycerol---prolipoprotein diacylglyceryl transferase
VVFPNFDPVALQLGSLAIRWYALAYVAGILLGWRYTASLIRSPQLWARPGPPLAPSALDDLVLWLTVGIILGGRLGYVAFYDTAVLWRDPLQVLKVWEGGMSFHGGLIGVVIAMALFARRHSVSLVALGDLVAPSVPIGLFFGRLANFVNGELWGRVTDVPWGVVFCTQRLAEAAGGVCPAGQTPRHPSQLYEAALEGVILFLILLWGVRGRGWLRRRGVVSGAFLVVYGASRIALETVRNPDLTMPTFPLGLTMGMMLSAPMIALGLALGLRAALSPPGTHVRS